MNPVATSQRPLGELFGELARDTATLVRNEAELATTEMTAKATSAAKDASIVGLGAVVAQIGGLVLAAAATLGLGMVLPLWLAALIVGAVLLALGGALAAAGVRKLKNVDPVPRITVQTLKENERWLKEQAAR